MLKLIIKAPDSISDILDRHNMFNCEDFNTMLPKLIGGRCHTNFILSNDDRIQIEKFRSGIIEKLRLINNSDYLSGIVSKLEDSEKVLDCNEDCLISVSNEGRLSFQFEDIKTSSVEDLGKYHKEITGMLSRYTNNIIKVNKSLHFIN